MSDRNRHTVTASNNPTVATPSDQLIDHIHKPAAVIRSLYARLISHRLQILTKEVKERFEDAFYTRQHNAKRVFATAEASVCLSVRPSVTLLYCVKTTQLRIMKSSLCDSLESLVSNEVISVPLGEEIPLERGHQRGYPPL